MPWGRHRPGGFRLSLLGYDPQTDYETILEEQRGRRLNLAHPEKSLILKKPSRQLPHEGGRRLPIDGDGFQVVHDWIKAGAPRGPGRSSTKIEVGPIAKLLDGVDGKFQVQVTAHFRDGTEGRRDQVGRLHAN